MDTRFESKIIYLRREFSLKILVPVKRVVDYNVKSELKMIILVLN